MAECEKAYVKLLSANGISSEGGELTMETVSGKIKRVAQAVIDGNSHFYVVLENKYLVFDIPVTEYPEIVKYDVGDTLTIEYTEGEPVCTVISLETIWYGSWMCGIWRSGCIDNRNDSGLLWYAGRQIFYMVSFLWLRNARGNCQL